MTKMVKYELKKILQSKFFIAVFLLSLAGMIAFSAVALYQYKTGVRGEYVISDMNGTKMPEVFVSDGNISELRAKRKTLRTTMRSMNAIRIPMAEVYTTENTMLIHKNSF